MARGGRREGAGRPPGAKTKAGRELRELAQRHTTTALNALVSILAGGEGIPPAAQVAAAKEILDRGYGKATQPISGDDDGVPIKTITQIRLIGPDGS